MKQTAPIAGCIAALGLMLPAATSLHAAEPSARNAASPIIALPLQPVVPAEQRLCLAKTATGLGYTALRPASGPKPGATDVALINYIGYLAANGNVFDQNMQTALPVDGVVPGFSEGLALMNRGSIYRFCLPAALAYGAAATGPIPANSDLVFQVELLDSRTLAEIEAMRKAQEAKPEK